MSSAVLLSISDNKNKNLRNHEQHLTRRGLMPLDSEAHHQALADIATVWLGGDSSILDGARIMIIDENGILHVDGIGYQPAWGDESEVLNACIQVWHLGSSLPETSIDIRPEEPALDTDLAAHIQSVATDINEKLATKPEFPILEAGPVGVKLAPGTIVFDVRTQNDTEFSFFAELSQQESRESPAPEVKVVSIEEISRLHPSARELLFILKGLSLSEFSLSHILETSFWEEAPRERRERAFRRHVSILRTLISISADGEKYRRSYKVEPFEIEEISPEDLESVLMSPRRFKTKSYKVSPAETIERAVITRSDVESLSIRGRELLAIIACNEGIDRFTRVGIKGTDFHVAAGKDARHKAVNGAIDELQGILGKLVTDEGACQLPVIEFDGIAAEEILELAGFKPTANLVYADPTKNKATQTTKPVKRKNNNGASGSKETDDLVRYYLSEISQHDLLTKDDEVRLAIQIAAGGKEGAEARDRFIKSNLRLVVSLAKRYQRAGVPLLDLIQNGNLGLMRAVDKFDWQRGFKFSTYASWWIRKALQTTVNNERPGIRVPEEIRAAFLELRRIELELSAGLGGKPTRAEIISKAQISPETAELAWRHGAAVLSMNDTFGDSDTELGDFMADPNAVSPEAAALDTEDSRALRKAIATLDPREQIVVLRHSGMHDGTCHNFTELDKELGLGRGASVRIFNRAKEKMANSTDLEVYRDSFIS